MGFFANTGLDYQKGLRDVIARELRDYKYGIHNEASIKKHIPEPSVFISDKNILTIHSCLYPEIEYKFDITPAINHIISKIIGCGIDLMDFNWDDLNIGCSWGQVHSAINIRVWVNKGKMTVKIFGPSYSIIPLYKHYYSSSRSSDGQKYIKFDTKYIFQEDIKVNPVSVCMDLRTSMSKYITDLQSGKKSADEVRTLIEQQIKNLK